ncbi:MAG: hypothetical protein IT452_12820 [Planctomycetia bacterium]|nr:hypothetical protein [Planctomycetia bacterium]
MRTLLAVLAVALACGAEEPAGPRDPSKAGPLPVASRKVAVPDDKPGATLEGVLFYPGAEAKDEAKPADGGPWPVCVFSPGGPAPTCAGYDDFGKRFASWGVVTLVVAFGDRQAAQRAPQMAAARDWLAKRNEDKGWFLQGKLDTNVFISAGHSRGGAAAILAAADAKKWAGCLTIGAALRELPRGYSTPTLLLGSPEDATLPSLYDGQKKPRWLLVVKGMDHFMNPASTRATTVAYATAWLGARFLKIDEFKAWTSGERGRRDSEDGVLADRRVDE